MADSSIVPSCLSGFDPAHPVAAEGFLDKLDGIGSTATSRYHHAPRGLYLMVMLTGGRLWRMNYRYDRKQKTLSFGQSPDLSLAKAREVRDIAREALAL